MRALVAAGVLALALPATAQAGTATLTGTTVAYTSAAGPEGVTVGFDPGNAFVRSDMSVTGSGACLSVNANEVNCGAGVTAFSVTFVSGRNSLRTDMIGSATITANGGTGPDDLVGGTNNDVLAGGDDGDSQLAGLEGNDMIDGGAGADYLYDGPGNDTLTGGPGNDSVQAGTGADRYDGGGDYDSISYSDRVAGVTVTDNGLADDGEAGEGDNATSFEDVTGGSGNDTIVGNDAGDRLHGGSGNDSIKGGAGEDRIEGDDGDDTIDSRDGRYDSIDCGSGNDTVYGDPQDATEGCEVAPDPDGDGYLAPADCAPNDPAVHPGAGEVFGNPIDEDCKGGPGYLRVISPIAYKYLPKHGRALFTKLLVSELKKGDRVEIRCNSRKKGCPFTRKKITIKAGHKSLNVAKLLKKHLFKRGAVIEVRILRANQIGKVQRYKVGKKGNVTAPKALCVKVGKTSATRCS